MASVEPHLFAVIPAAGVGSRFSGDIQKQYAPLLSTTVLEHSAAAMLAIPMLQQLIIAIHDSDTFAATLPQLQDARVRCVAGGVERTDSVLCALQALQHSAADHDWVLVHDAARPCLTDADCARLLDALWTDTVGGVLAVPVIDTLKHVENGAVVRTIDRRVVWQAQTPQMFRFGVLLDALLHAKREGIAVTDEASAIEAMGLTAKIVEGSRSNIKITYPEDLALAAFYISQEASR